MKLKLFFLIFLLTNIAFSADYFWVNGSGNWSDFANHWALSTGGTTMHTQAPTISDNVYFDSNSFVNPAQTVTLDVNGFCRELNWETALNTPTFLSTTDSLTVFSSVYLTTNMNLNFNGTLVLKASAQDSIHTYNHIFGGEIYIKAVGYTLQSNLSTTGLLSLEQGALEVNNFTLTANRFNADYTPPSTLTLTTGIINITGFGLAWATNNSSFTFNKGTSNLNFTYTGTNKVLFNPASINYNNVTFNGKNNTFLDGGTYARLTFVEGSKNIFPDFKVQNITTLITAIGNCGELITLTSDQSVQGGQAIFIKGGGENLNFTRISNLQIVSGTYAANNSIDEGNNTNVNITESPSTTTFYWIGGTGEWSDPNHWSLFSGGAPQACLPNVLDNVIFDMASGFNTDTVFLDINGYCNNMDWSAVTNSPVLFGDSSKFIRLKGSLTLSPLLTSNFDGDFIFNGTGTTNTINTAYIPLNSNFYFENSGTWTLDTNIQTLKKLYLKQGNLDFNEFNGNIGGLLSGGNSLRSLDLELANLVLNGIDTAWLIEGSNYTLTVDTSVITMNASSNLVTSFFGGNEQYYTLILNALNAEILDANSFKLLKINKGKSVALASGLTQSTDSLIANGSCDSIITIQSTSNILTPAELEKTGYDTVGISYCLIKNVNATGGLLKRNFTAYTNFENTTNNWTDTLAPSGTTLYWIGNTGNWSNKNNWSLASGGTPYSCIPNSQDTVVFDANSFSANNQIVTLDVDGACAKMDWSTIAFSPEFAFERDLNVRYEAILHPNLIITRNNNFSAIYFNTNTNSTFDPQNATADIGFIYIGEDLLDTLTLISNLNLGSDGVLIIGQGTFINDADTIIANSFNLFTDEPKSCFLNDGYLNLSSGWSAENLTLTTLNAGTSHINITGGLAQDYFYGNGFTYYDVTFNYVSDTSLINGANTFNKLIIKPGVNIKIENGVTQTINDSLIAKGTCYDSISITSSQNGSQATFNINSPQYLTECLNIKDISITGGPITTLFSSDKGNTSGITFSPTTSSVPNFTLASFQVCFGDSIKPVNTSTAFSGNTNDLTYLWEFGNLDSSFVEMPAYLYPEAGLFYIDLTTTYTNGCSESYRDSVNVNNPMLNLFASDPDSTICDGEEVGFVTSVSGDSYQFFKNGTPIGPMSVVNTYTTDTLANNDTIWATTLLNGCPAASIERYVFTVNPNPTASLTFSTPSDTICDYDSVIFTGAGGVNYQYFLNSLAQNIPSAVDSFIFNNLVTNDSVFMISSFPLTGCNTTSDTFAFTVNPTPIVTFTNTGSNVICDRDTLVFEATGGETYQYSINSVPVGAYTTNPTFESNTLSSLDTVRVIGDSLGCLNKGNNDFIIVVNPIPNTSLSTPSNTICSGDNLTYTFTGASIYEVFINDVSQGVATGATTYSSATFNDGDRIRVLGSTFGCDSLSLEDTVTVLPLPIVNLTNTDPDTIICIGDTVTFTATGASQYQFLVNGIPATTLSAINTYSTDSLLDGQTVTVKGITGTCEDISSNTYTFNVKPVPNINLSVNKTIICERDIVNFIAVGGATYEFYVDNVLQAGPTATNTYNTDSLPVGSPVVDVIGYLNGCSSNANTNYTIQVNPAPTVLLAIVSDTICDGDTVRASVSGATNYQFLLNGNPTTAYSSITAFESSSLTNNQTLSARGELNGCFSNSDTTYTIVVNAIPTVSFMSSDLDDIICEGDSITFTASGADNYIFTIDDTIPLPIQTAGVYISDSLKNNQRINLIAESNGCFATVTNSYTITVNALPIVSLTTTDSDTTICFGEAITLTGSGANLYDFKVNNTSITGLINSANFSPTNLNNGDVISLVGQSSSGCVDSSSTLITVTVNIPPVVSFTSSDTDGLLCENDQIIVKGSGANNYKFFIDGVSQGISGPVDSLVIDSINGGQIITVIGESNGCERLADTSFSFQVFNYPIVSFTKLDSTIPCIGDSSFFMANGGLEYEFFIDGVLQNTKTTNNNFADIINNGQVISVIGYNNICPSNGDTAYTVSVNNYPTITTSTIPAGPTFCFDDTITFNSLGASSYQYFYNGIAQSNIINNPQFKISQLETGDTITTIGYNGKCMSNIIKTALNVTKLNLTLTSANNNLFCDTDPIVFTANGATQYQFEIDNITQGPFSTTNTLTAAFINNGGSVSVIGNGSGCTQRSQTQYVNILKTPQVTPAGPIQICDGNEIDLKSNSEYGNIWFKNNTQIPNEYDSLLTISTSGTYYTNLTQGGDGEVWSFGNNSNGEFGNELNTTSLIPTTALNVLQGIDLASGENHMVFIKADGTVWAWGDNDLGQLGDGSFTDNNSPQQVAGIANATDATAGANFTIILHNNSLTAFGDNSKGQLGLGTNGIASFPVAVPALNNIIQVSGGGEFTVALDNTGSVWTWGDNQFAQLGNGTFTNSNTPTTIGLTNVIAVSAGKTHALALKADGTVWAWGDNSLGQLGINGGAFLTIPTQLTTINGITKISAGADHSLLIDNKNNVYAFGDNTFGQLGTGNNNSMTIPTKVSNIKAQEVFAGYYNSYAIGTDESVLSWGKNQYGQLGDQSFNNKNTPIVVNTLKGASIIASGSEHTSGLMTYKKTCQSNIVAVTVDTIPTITVSVTSDTILNTPIVGISYQWFLNGIAIPGALTDTWGATTHGTYTVQVTFANGCVGESDGIIILPIGLKELQNGISINVYPNPTNDIINVQLLKKGDKIRENVSFEIYNTLGAIVLSETNTSINLNLLENGIYYLTTILDGKRINIKKIIKQ